MIKALALYTLFLLIPLSSFGIVGGDFVSAGDPILTSTAGLSNGCTGTLITRRIVMTAAHCVVSPQRLSVIFGLSFQNGEAIPAIEIFIHPEYNNNADGVSPEEPTSSPVHDIALVKLLQDAPAGFNPAPLGSGQNLFNGDELILAGFGQTLPSGGGFGSLKSVKTLFNFYNTNALEVVFGPTPGESACRGDSGGPMYIKRNNTLLVIGVTSRGFSSLGPCSGSGNYTEVKAHQNWINNTIAVLNLSLN